jgi:hypothetical protein
LHVLVASVTLGMVILVMASAFITGALARLAVPGPDPMPAWLTVSMGLAGFFGGGAIAYAAGARNPFAVNTAGFVATVLLVIGYRRFVQQRPITGPGAMRFPQRGLGIDRYHDRLRKLGIDPRKPLHEQRAGVGGSEPETGQDEVTENLRKLADLHDAGVLSDEEFQAKKAELISRL